MRSLRAVGTLSRRPRGAFRLVVALSAVTLAGAVAGPQALAAPRHPAVPRSAAHWHVVATMPGALFRTLTVQSKTSAWAFGYGISKSGDVVPAGLHWNGSRWRKVTFPAGLGSTAITCAGASSATNVWAFAGSPGPAFHPTSFGALRLVGGRWKLVKKFSSGEVMSCAVLSRTDVWAFRAGLSATDSHTAHLSGKTWRTEPTPGYVLFFPSTVNRTKNIWAYGFANPTGTTEFPAVARWNGDAWVRNTALNRMLPRPSKTAPVWVRGLTALSDSNVWLGVAIVHAGTVTYLTLHWNGHRWSKVGPANPGYYMPGAVSDGHGGWWSYPLPANPQRVYLLHWNGHRWVRVPAALPRCIPPVPVWLAAVPGTSSMLGIGANCGLSGVPGGGALVVAYGPLP